MSPASRPIGPRWTFSCVWVMAGRALFMANDAHGSTRTLVAYRDDKAPQIERNGIQYLPFPWEPELPARMAALINRTEIRRAA